MNKRVSIYKNIKTGTYHVQPFTVGPVAATEFGDPTLILPDDFLVKVNDAVIHNLEKFGMEKYDRAESRRCSSTQQEEFLEQHIGVSVHELESGDLAIYPLHHEGGGMVGSDNNSIILSSDDIPHKLASAIAEAFKRTT